MCEEVEPGWEGPTRREDLRVRSRVVDGDRLRVRRDEDGAGDGEVLWRLRRERENSRRRGGVRLRLRSADGERPRRGGGEGDRSALDLPLRFSCARSWSSRERVSAAPAFELSAFSEDSSSSARESDCVRDAVLCFAGRREASESQDGERRDVDGVRLKCRRRWGRSPLRSRLFLSGRSSPSSPLRSGDRLRFRWRRCLLCSRSSSASRCLECRCELRSCRDPCGPLLSRSCERDRGACRRSRFSDMRSRLSSRSSRSQLRSLRFRSLRRSRSQSSDLLDLPLPCRRLNRSASAASSARALRSRRSCSSLSSRTSCAASAWARRMLLLWSSVFRIMDERKRLFVLGALLSILKAM